MPEFSIEFNLAVTRKFAGREEAEKWADVTAQDIEMEIDDLVVTGAQCIIVKVEEV